MLIIHGRIITSPDDHALVEVFRRSFERNEVTARTVDWYILNRAVYRFPSIAAFVRRVLSDGTDDRVLAIQCTHPTHPGPYRIHMTGSRAEDFVRANLRAGLAVTPTNFTWHHSEGIIQTGGGYDCDMYLIDSYYHGSRRHRGGVYEYERLTNRKYR